MSRGPCEPGSRLQEAGPPRRTHGTSRSPALSLWFVCPGSTCAQQSPCSVLSARPRGAADYTACYFVRFSQPATILRGLEFSKPL